MTKELITSIILSGGKSSRMGIEKGLVKLNGKSLIEYVIDAAKNITCEIIIIANTDEYSRFGYKVFPDIIKDCGPMGGIFTGLNHSDTKKNFVLSCDIPFVSVEALKYINDNSSDCEIAVPIHNGNIEPLCGMYSKSCTEKFKQLIIRNKLKIADALKNFRMKTVNVSTQKFYSKNLFQNINTKAELLFANNNYQ